MKTIFKRTLAAAMALMITGLFLTTALASSIKEIQEENDLTSYRTLYDVTPVEITVPTRIKVTLPNLQNYGVAVIENETETAQPIATINETEFLTAEIKESSSVRGSTSALVDGDRTTVAEFNLDEDGGQAFVVIEFPKMLKSSSLSLELDSHVALPHKISIQAEVDGEWITVLANTKPYQTLVTFPQRTAEKWRIKFSHSQPLRLRELTFSDDTTQSKFTGDTVIWLARPGETYQLYADAATYKRIKTGESGDLLSDPEEIEETTISKGKPNPLFTEPDDDEDGVPNYLDNCMSVSNASQVDIDDNGSGDDCDDYDRDGVINSKDNCQEYANSNQKDTDGDDIGDACDDEESRITESNPWIPWLAMGIAALAVFGLIIHTLRKK
ncbi:hypothetical protein HOE49_01210 [Candidatus Peregrinibacteria bacterium]|nr:hypothetical protein [Candidatus Peregrinibacteria bacterium]